MIKFFKRLKTLRKIFVISILILFVLSIFTIGKIYSKKDLFYGATFSRKHAMSLELDWKDVFLSAMDDLKIKRFRIPAYWDEVQALNDKDFNFEALDWQIKEAEKRGVEIILAVGGRLPRWPECHFPAWTEKITREEKEEKTLKYIETTVNRYKGYSNIYAWQIENEPFLAKFGECPELNPKFLDEEIALVKELDNRPIVVTDSGELSLWVPAAKRADIFGSSVYLNTYSKALGSYVHYPIGPKFFHFKRNMTKLFTKPQEIVLIELQAEPWGKIPYQLLSEEEKSKTMNIEKFRNILKFSHEAGFKEFYLWGLEWWYWEKEKNNNDDYWKEARELFDKGY